MGSKVEHGCSLQRDPPETASSVEKENTHSILMTHPAGHFRVRFIYSCKGAP